MTRADNDHWQAEIGARVRRLSAAERAALAALVELPTDGTRLVAAVVSSSDSELPQQEIRRFLMEKLPSQAVPSEFISLDSIPRNQHGKVDRRAVAAQASVTTRDTPTELVVGSSQHVVEKLIAVWQRVLGVHVDPHERYLELGGNSIKALQIVSGASDHGIQLRPADLLSNPSVFELARHVEQAGGNWSPLVELQPLGSKPPFFAVHGIAGEALSFHHLAAEMSEDRPFIGIEAFGRVEGQRPDDTIEQAADRYLAAVQARQPHGPYYLGGFSSGIVIAYEMAQRLLTAGEEVALLASFDSAPFNVPRPTSPLWRNLWRFVRNLPGWLRIHMSGDEFRRTIARAKTIATSWAATRKSEDEQRVPESKALNEQLDVERVFGTTDLSAAFRAYLEIHYRAAATYRPRPANVKITLLQAKVRPFWPGPELREYWLPLAKKGVQTHIVPGDHGGLTKATEARRIARALAQAIENQERSERK